MVNNLVYDVGMNNGDDTKYYLHLGYNVIAIDASPDLVDRAKVTFENEIKENRLEIINIGIASEEGVLDFYLNKHHSAWNSFDFNIGSRGGSGYEVIKVRTRSIHEIIKEKGVPYYLKIDIEGYDKTCLESLININERPKIVSVELSEMDLILKLKELGYNKFKIIDQQSFLSMELPQTKEYNSYWKLMKYRLSMKLLTRITRKLFGKIIVAFYEKQFKYLFKYNHPHGSSGPFGENLPGKWLTFEDAVYVYLFYKKRYGSLKRSEEYSYWIDIHATT